MPESKWEMGRAPEEPDTILIGSGGTFWCRVVGAPGEPAEPKARLMLAAPELLAEVEKSAQGIIDIFNADMIPKDERLQMFVTIATRLFAAARKAKGESL